MVTVLCRFCYAQQLASRLREKAKFEKVRNLASSLEQTAQVMEALAEGAKRCTCGEPIQKLPRVKPKPITDPDCLDDAL